MDDGKPLIDYPCTYLFKVIGRAGADFPDHVRRLVSSVVGYVAPDSVSVRESSGGKYESVTLHVQLPSEDVRRRVYQALWDDDRVVFYL